jgi:purine-binding chemotaxis protein CheW
MERAKRIRRMRDGQRDEGEEPSEEPDDQPTAEASTDDTATATPDAETDADGPSARADDDAMPEQLGSTDGTRAELPSTDEMEAAMEHTVAQAEVVEEDDGAATDEGVDDEEPTDGTATPAGVADSAETTREPETRVLEFTLDDEQYCLDIEYIEEIVKHTSVTRVPNTPEFVEGVVDLRGQITTILNPKVTIDKPNKQAGDLIVVFDGEAFEDQGHIGWVVDDVRQVSPVRDSEVNDPPMADDHINGVIDRGDDEEFVIWTTPDLALETGE